MDLRLSAPNGLPALLVVDANDQAREKVAAALIRRFGADYRVMTAGSAASGLGSLDQLAAEGIDLGLVAANYRLPGTDGIEFLAQAHVRHPAASRALLIDMDKRGTRIPFGELDALQRATALGRIDFWLVNGWQSPEELLYPRVQEALSEWTRLNRPQHEVIRIVDRADRRRRAVLHLRRCPHPVGRAGRRHARQLDQRPRASRIGGLTLAPRCENRMRPQPGLDSAGATLPHRIHGRHAFVGPARP